MSTSNQRIRAVEPVLAPADLLNRFPINEAAEKLITETRSLIGDILHKRDPRLLVVVGPCSIHDTAAAMEYGQWLAKQRDKYADSLEIVMRVYFEKPRSTVGWKGLINDPRLDGSYDVSEGLTQARKLLLDLNSLGVPAGCEFLDAVTGQYYADLVSWGAIGARTTESQVHRELASGLSCPVGFKNGTNGNVDIACDAIIAANAEHIFLSPDESGKTAMFTTSGNQDAHIILRGGREPNYDKASVAAADKALQERAVKTGIMIDFSHANSRKEYHRQVEVGTDVAGQIQQGDSSIVGCMIESHLIAGRQNVVSGEPLVYGQSITDACIDIAATEKLFDELSQAVKTRQQTV